MSIVKIDYREDLFDHLWELLTQAFPEEELPEREVLARHLEEPDCLCSFLFDPENSADDPDDPDYFKPDGVYIGYAFDDFFFGEYLAIREEKRNNGMGTEFMLDWKERADKPLLFESELPETEIAERRLNFYASLGFCFYDRPYAMPAQREGDEPIPMQLMGGAGMMKPEELEHAVRLIYTVVYKHVIDLEANAELRENIQ